MSVSVICFEKVCFPKRLQIWRAGRLHLTTYGSWILTGNYSFHKIYKKKTRRRFGNELREVMWVCLKMGYTPNYSHLVGIMISKTIGCRGTRHFQTHPCWNFMALVCDQPCPAAGRPPADANHRPRTPGGGRWGLWSWTVRDDCTGHETWIWMWVKMEDLANHRC